MMLNLGRVIAAVVITGINFVNASGVKAMVDTVEVLKGNPVTLRIKAVGENAVFPEIQSIDNTPVIGTSTSKSRNLSIVNGQMSSEQIVTKIIRFIPEGNMTIPSYTVTVEGKEYQTDPIDIKVVNHKSDMLEDNGVFSLKMQTNKIKVMTGEPFVLTVYFALKEGIRLSQDVQYQPPGLSDFVVTELSEQKTYKRGKYKVQEIRYIVTPQKEGNFTIAPAQAKIGLPDLSRRDIFGLSYATKWIEDVSNALQIEVFPLESQADVIGDFTVNTNIDKNKTKSNKPVNFTVKIEGKGSLDGFEFPKYEIDGVTVYSDEADIETKIVDGEIYSSYTKKFAFISENDFTIPTREITIYSPSKKAKQILEIKGFFIRVEGGSKEALETQVIASVSAHSDKNTTAKVQTEGLEVENIAWWMLASAFLLGMSSTYLVQYLSRWLKVNKREYKESDALKILYGHIGEDEKAEEMVRKLYAKKRGDKSVVIDKKELKEILERFR